MPTADSNTVPDTIGRWSCHESEMLAIGYQRFGDGRWTQLSRWLASQNVHRCATQCRHRWQKTMRPDLKKGHWAEGEDARLVAAVRLQEQEKKQKHAAAGYAGRGTNWQAVAQAVTHRTGKACRERWVSHLDPAINHAPLTHDEGQLILHLHETVFKNQWSKIAERLPGRTAEAVKSKWKTLTRFRWERSEKKAAGSEAAGKRKQAEHRLEQQCDHAAKRQKAGVTDDILQLLEVLNHCMRTPQPITASSSSVSLETEEGRLTDAHHRYLSRPTGYCADGADADEDDISDNELYTMLAVHFEEDADADRASDNNNKAANSQQQHKQSPTDVDVADGLYVYI